MNGKNRGSNRDDRDNSLFSPPHCVRRLGSSKASRLRPNRGERCAKSAANDEVALGLQCKPLPCDAEPDVQTAGIRATIAQLRASTHVTRTPVILPIERLHANGY
jgi:hypothetical protein